MKRNNTCCTKSDARRQLQSVIREQQGRKCVYNTQFGINMTGPINDIL